MNDWPKTVPLPLLSGLQPSRPRLRADRPAARPRPVRAVPLPAARRHLVALVLACSAWVLGLGLGLVCVGWLVLQLLQLA